MLSAHTLLITGICVVYFGSMAGLLAYIARTARPEDPPEDSRDRDEDRAEITAIAA